MPARENGGTSRVDTTSAATTRPDASRSGTRSVVVTGRATSSMSARASSSGMVSLMGRIRAMREAYPTYTHEGHHGHEDARKGIIIP